MRKSVLAVFFLLAFTAANSHAISTKTTRTPHKLITGSDRDSAFINTRSEGGYWAALMQNKENSKPDRGIANFESK